jgi:hypothetical protein
VAKTEIGRRSSAPRTEGQRRLLAVDLAVRKLAEQLRVSPGLLSEWRAGAKLPGPKWRGRLEAELAIPATSWTRRPEGARPPKTKPAAPPAPAPTAAELDEDLVAEPITVEAARAHAKTLFDALNDPGDDLEPALRSRLSDSYTKALALVGKLELDAQALDHRIATENPRWHAIRKTIAKALEPHPDALRDVIAALEPLEAWRKEAS